MTHPHSQNNDIEPSPIEKAVTFMNLKIGDGDDPIDVLDDAIGLIDDRLPAPLHGLCDEDRDWALSLIEEHGLLPQDFIDHLEEVGNQLMSTLSHCHWPCWTENVICIDASRDAYVAAFLDCCTPTEPEQEFCDFHTRMDFFSSVEYYAQENMSTRNAIIRWGFNNDRTPF